MRVLVTGAQGMLGSEVVAALEQKGHTPVPMTRSEFDISDSMSAARIVESDLGELDWCINCAAYTAVDKAEEERQAAYEVNALGPSYLAMALDQAKVRFLHVSTDFVFDGLANEPYTEEDATNPLGAYGMTKLQGEAALLGKPLCSVVRTSWLFGASGACFPKSILRAFDAGKELRVVSDQIGSPTYVPYLAGGLVEFIERDPFPGVYHLAGSEAMSWFTFAEKVLQSCREATEVISPIKTEDWPTPARRPKYSVLDSSKLHDLGVSRFAPLEVALRDFCSKL